MSVTPEKVVESFYNWYVGYPGNLVVDGAYRSSEYLTEEFIQKVDGIIASFDKGGYDPFLCAQDIPGEFTIEKAMVSGEKASVVVHEVWNPGTQYELNHNVTVVLRMADGQWEIADILCPRVGSAAWTPRRSEPMIPALVVAGFYDWYIRYARNVGNPMVDEAYRSSEYLTEELVHKMDGIIASFESSGYDPFLCAQDIPASFAVDTTVISDDEASVGVHTSFEDHKLTVALRRVSGEWKIADVLCLVPEPIVVVSAEGCPTATTGTQFLMNERHGYCLLYPAGYDVQHPNEHETVLFVGSLLNVEQPRGYIKVQEAGGRTAAQVADELTAAFAGFDIKRTNATIGGEAAVVLDNMPGQDTNRQVVMVHDDRLYMLTFVPASEDYGEVYTQMENLYTMVLNSFHFSISPSVTSRSAGT